MTKDQFDHWLQQIYGITLEDYNQMFSRQGGKCAICGKSQTDHKRRFGIDHDHKTGQVRGILCHSCNHILGIYEKYGEQMQNYLDQPVFSP